MLSVRKVLSVLALGVLALSASSVEAARIHHHRAAQVAPKAPATITARAVLEEEFQMEFTKFMKVHDKEYSVDELFVRYGIFKDNYKTMIQHNAEADAGKHTWRQGVNAFTDMTKAEFKSKMLTYNGEASSPAPSMKEWQRPAHWNISSANIPDYVDWRGIRAVGVKDQGQCGSCWSFGSIAALESSHVAAGGGLVALSEQQLIDCAGSNYGCNGCNGGNNEGAFQYVHDAGGVTTEDAYPYHASQGGCAGAQGGVAATVSNINRLPEDEGAMADAVANHGVLAVALDASTLQGYNGGIYSGPCTTTRDHSVAIVGYGWDQPSGKSFWIVKNSWGNWGGQGGYFWIERGNNMCGIAGDASYPDA